MGTKFRDKVVAKAENIEGHPYNLGVSMQAHHLVSKNGCKLSDYKEELEKLGYEIDDIDNLVLIPNEPFDACHMEVQVHRSNHSVGSNISSILSKDDIHDDDHPMSYHEIVSNMIKGKSGLFKQVCESDKDSNKKKEKIQKEINKLSKKILSHINSFELLLTSAAENFQTESKIGCSNFNNIKKNRELEKCISKRNHNNLLPKPYILTQGK
jgi:hypothetical protein